MLREWFKIMIHRFCGYKISGSNFNRFSYDKRNFQLHTEKPVIFDVGANIGQSVYWFKSEFYKSIIYAFEPFPYTYKKLKKNTKNFHFVKHFNVAISNSNCFLNVRPYKRCEGTAKLEEVSGPDSITVKCLTVDSFCVENNINFIDIIKIDTEGHELKVINGAKEMLSKGKIGNIIIEASIFENDIQHTMLKKISQKLEEYNYNIKSFYDLSHKNNGELNYMNVHFVRGE